MIVVVVGGEAGVGGWLVRFTLALSGGAEGGDCCAGGHGER